LDENKQEYKIIKTKLVKRKDLENILYAYEWFNRA